MSGPAPRPVEERFWEKVAFIGAGPGDCWLWTGAAHPRGYGHISAGGRHGKTWNTHRLAYELEVGPIPDGMEIDHLCSTPRCVNPDHLEPVTGAENSRRAGEHGLVGKHRTRETHCVNGHEYTATNTGENGRGARRCLGCAKERARRRREARA